MSRLVATTFAHILQIQVLADDKSSAFYMMGPIIQIGTLVQSTNKVVDSFKSGIGFDYDAHGSDMSAGIEAEQVRHYSSHYCCACVCYYACA